MALRLLITNTSLSGRSGTEIFVAQLADKLRSLGHEVILYSPQVGELGLALRKRGHFVFDRIASISARPDFIHGHHVGPLMAAMAAFPETPAIQILHSVEAELDAPLTHPQIVSHFAVSEYIRAQRATSQLPVDAIGIVRNAVDLDRYSFRERSIAKPKAALSIAKYPGGSGHIERACASMGIALTEIGPAVSRIVDDLASRFDAADIVFASGRSALEAIASGCAVILTDGGWFGGLITTRVLDQLLALNFGVRAMPHRVSYASVSEVIARLDWTDVVAVSRRVREVASLDRQADQLLMIYKQALAKQLDLSKAARDLAALVEQYVPTHGDLPWSRLAHDVALGALQRDLAHAARRYRFPNWGTADGIAPLVTRGKHQFGLDQPSSEWLESGWWTAEDWGVWSKPHGVLFARLDSDVRRIVLQYRLFGTTPRAKLEISTTGLELDLGGYAPDAVGIRTAAFVVPAECHEKGCLDLTFQAENASSPAEAGVSNDLRRLGVGLISLHAK